MSCNTCPPWRPQPNNAIDSLIGLSIGLALILIFDFVLKLLGDGYSAEEIVRESLSEIGVSTKIGEEAATALLGPTAGRVLAAISAPLFAAPVFAEEGKTGAKGSATLSVGEADSVIR